jgi:hypothetical protein
MELNDWVQAVLQAMILYPNLSTIVGDDWKGWGMMFFNDPYLSSLSPPNPHDFNRWQDWGYRLIIAMESAPDSYPNSNTGPNPPGPPLINGRFLVTQDNRFLITQDNRFIVTQS